MLQNYYEFFTNLEFQYSNCQLDSFIGIDSIQKIKSRFEAILIVHDASSKCINNWCRWGSWNQNQDEKLQIYYWEEFCRILSACHQNCKNKPKINASNLIRFTKKQLKTLREDLHFNEIYKSGKICWRIKYWSFPIYRFIRSSEKKSSGDFQKKFKIIS